MKLYVILLSLEYFTLFHGIYSNDLEHENTAVTEFSVDGDFSPLIGNGDKANQGEFPWMVAIYKQEKYICSGFIISSTIVVSAAHCFFRKEKTDDPDLFYGFAGNVKRSGNGTRLYFESIKIHPEYDETLSSENGAFNNDLVLLKTQHSIIFNENIRPICIFKTEPAPIYFAKAIGWGITTKDDGSPSDVLRYVRLLLTPNKLCSPAIAVGDRSKICTVKLHGGVCTGDSGGPLVYFGQQPVAIGITSYGKNDCKTLLRFAVFTRIAFYTKFILENSEDVCVL